MLLSWLLPDKAFIAWGLVSAFILSAVLVLVGAYIRTSRQETQDFASAKKHVEKDPPMLDAFKRYPKTLLACVGALSGRHRLQRVWRVLPDLSYQYLRC